MLHVLDINECAAEIDDCVDTLATCVDTQPGYGCLCLSGYHGDGRVNGTGCVDDNECKTLYACLL